MKNSVIVVINSRIVILVEKVICDKLVDSFLRKVWVNSTCTVAKKCSKMMYLSWLAAFKNDSA